MVDLRILGERELKLCLGVESDFTQTLESGYTHSVSMCLRKLGLPEKPLPHLEHEKGVIPGWVLMCLLRLVFCRKDRLHIVH